MSVGTTTLTANVDSADVIRLIQHHLTECGLHASCRALREESGIGAAATHSDLAVLCEAGRWGEVQEVLSTLDRRRVAVSQNLMADVHEMTVLELAEIGETDLACATLRLLAEDDNSGAESTASLFSLSPSRAASVERKVRSLASMRKRGDTGGVIGGQPLPPDYYGENNIGRQKRRDAVGRRLAHAVPSAPRARLISLLQQAVKWQSHTGQLPMATAGANNDGSDDEDETGDGSLKRKKNKRRRKKKVIIDIVLGEVPELNVDGGDEGCTSGAKPGVDSRHVGSIVAAIERIPTSEAGQIKFGKESYPECALFLPDGSGLVTGSSDGFVEIWDPKKWGRLRTHDLPYQRDDELMLHDAAVLAVAHSIDGEMIATGSADGTVKVWKISTGKCLREFERAHSGAVRCLAFRRDGSHLLTGSQDALCREFGLRASRMLKEFRGHASYLNACVYLGDAPGGVDSSSTSSTSPLVATASGDGTCIIWDGKSSEVLRVLHPAGGVEMGTNITTATAPSGDLGTAVCGGKSIHTVLSLHTPAETLLIVPRGPAAYLVNDAGMVMRTYSRDSAKGGGRYFVAATISPSNRWLYCVTEDGYMVCFDVAKCDEHACLFLDLQAGEVSGLAHHPHQGIMASFSNHKYGKGKISIWK